jgi:hypothetical protein
MRVLLLFFFFAVCYSSDINLEEFKKEMLMLVDAYDKLLKYCQLDNQLIHIVY